jgi:hypothetical protein
VAFPFLLESNFESGSNAEWTSETDTVSQLDFPHYSELARYPWKTCVPFQGAYCARVVLSGGTADAFVSSTSTTIALDTLRWVRFNIWFSPTFTATADDTFAICELQSSGAVVEVSFGARVVAATNVINFGIGETAPTTFSPIAVDRGVWYTIELKVDLDAGGGNDGTIDLFVTRFGEPAASAVAATQVATLDQAAITNTVLGVQDQLATTTGVYLLDHFVFDDARIYPQIRRYDDTVLLTKSGHAFVGRGTIDNITLMSGAATDNVCSVYDTDVADTNDATSLVLELKNTANSELVDPAGTPVDVVRGCYVSLTGTNPRALVKMCGVQAYTDANTRSLGLNRKV